MELERKIQGLDSKNKGMNKWAVLPDLDFQGLDKLGFQGLDDVGFKGLDRVGFQGSGDDGFSGSDYVGFSGSDDVGFHGWDSNVFHGRPDDSKVFQGWIGVFPFFQRSASIFSKHRATSCNLKAQLFAI